LLKRSHRLCCFWGLGPFQQRRSAASAVGAPPQLLPVVQVRHKGRKLAGEPAIDRQVMHRHASSIADDAVTARKVSG
jgi:hypothetical protein